MSIVIWRYYFLFRYSSLVPQKPNIRQKPFMYSFMSKLVLSISPSSSHLRPPFTPPFHLPSFSSTTLPFFTYPHHLPFVPSLSPSLHFLSSLPLLSVIILFVESNMKNHFLISQNFSVISEWNRFGYSSKCPIHFKQVWQGSGLFHSCFTS